MSPTQRNVEYNSTAAVLGSTVTGKILQELLAEDGMLKDVSPVEERDGERIERWYFVTLKEDFGERYERYLRQLHVRSNMKQIKDLIEAVKEEMKLQVERGVEECVIGYDNIPEEFAINANLYYALLLMDLEGGIVIKCIQDKSRWVPSVKHPERQYLHDFIFHTHSSEIPRTVAPKNLDEVSKPLKWSTLDTAVSGNSDDS